MSKLADDAKGRWPDILTKLGVDKAFLTSRHGPCPMCAGKDRFRFDDKDGRGTWICSQCGAGDGIKLVMLVNGLEFREAAREIEKHLGTARTFTIRQGPPPEKVKASMAAIWRRSIPLAECPATRLWWMARTGRMPTSPDLRAVASLDIDGQFFPAMVAKIRDAEGHWVNLHRTFLTMRGEKAPIDDPRRVMPLQLPDGSAIRLCEPGPTLGIAEGIETAEAAAILHGIPSWAVVNSVMLQKWEPPVGVGAAVIFGDNDANATGQAAAWALARKLRMRKPPTMAMVELPDGEGEDWNDVLRAKGGLEHVAA